MNKQETDLNKKFPSVPLNLEILAEEAAEIIQVLGRIIQLKSKITRFGVDDIHPKNGAANIKCLTQEIGDFSAMAQILIDNKVLNYHEIKEAKDRKLKKLGKWYRS